MTTSADTSAHDEQRMQALALRDEGFDRKAIARSLAVSTWRVTELLHGAKPTNPRLRARAKDDEQSLARQLRLDGYRLEEIAAKLGVAKSSVSLWVRDLPKPEARPRTYSMTHVAAVRRGRWDALLAERERERQEVMGRAAAEVGTLSDRELLLLGAALYWAEGSKSKPWRRQERLVFINSDPDVIRLYLRWLLLLGIKQAQIGAAISIHENADIDKAHAYWQDLTGLPEPCFLRPQLKRHTAKTVRKNVGNAYYGCLILRVRRSRLDYQRMAGLWRGIVSGSPSGVV